MKMKVKRRDLARWGEGQGCKTNAEERAGNQRQIFSTIGITQSKVKVQSRKQPGIGDKNKGTGPAVFCQLVQGI